MAKVAVANQLVNGAVVSDKNSLAGQVDENTIDTSAGESIALGVTEPRQIRSSIQIFLQKLIPSIPTVPLSSQWYLCRFRAGFFVRSIFENHLLSVDYTAQVFNSSSGNNETGSNELCFTKVPVSVRNWDTVDTYTCL